MCIQRYEYKMHIYAYARVEIVYVCMDMPTGCIYMQRYKYETHVYAGLTMAVARWRWRDGGGEYLYKSRVCGHVSDLLTSR